MLTLSGLTNDVDDAVGDGDVRLDDGRPRSEPVHHQGRVVQVHPDAAAAPAGGVGERHRGPEHLELVLRAGDARVVRGHALVDEVEAQQFLAWRGEVEIWFHLLFVMVL